MHYFHDRSSYYCFGTASLLMIATLSIILFNKDVLTNRIRFELNNKLFIKEATRDRAIDPGSVCKIIREAISTSAIANSNDELIQCSGVHYLFIYTPSTCPPYLVEIKEYSELLAEKFSASVSNTHHVIVGHDSLNALRFSYVYGIANNISFLTRDQLLDSHLSDFNGDILLQTLISYNFETRNIEWNLPIRGSVTTLQSKATYLDEMVKLDK